VHALVRARVIHIHEYSFTETYVDILGTPFRDATYEFMRAIYTHIHTHIHICTYTTRTPFGGAPVQDLEMSSCARIAGLSSLPATHCCCFELPPVCLCVYKYVCSKRTHSATSNALLLLRAVASVSSVCVCERGWVSGCLVCVCEREREGG
jgi:hypothetical protein